MPLGDAASLIASIRRHTHIPVTHPSYPDSVVLADATEELYSYLLPLGMTERQELWAGPVAKQVVPLSSGRTTYTISGRTIGTKLRAVRLLGPGNEVQLLNYYSREDVDRAINMPGLPSGLVVEGNTFRLFPTPNNTYNWRMEVSTYVRPGALVPLAQCAPIINAAFNASSTTVTVAIGVDNNDIIVSQYLDVVASSPPFDTLVMESVVLSIDEVSPGTREITLDGVLDVTTGDYLCLPGQSPVVQAPLEWHPLLALKVATRELLALGDMEMASAKIGELKQKQEQASALIRPRREDVARKPRNGMDRWRGVVLW